MFAYQSLDFFALLRYGLIHVSKHFCVRLFLNSSKIIVKHFGNVYVAMFAETTHRNENLILAAATATTACTIFAWFSGCGCVPSIHGWEFVVYHSLVLGIISCWDLGIVV